MVSLPVTIRMKHECYILTQKLRFAEKWNEKKGYYDIYPTQYSVVSTFENQQQQHQWNPYHWIFATAKRMRDTIEYSMLTNISLVLPLNVVHAQIHAAIHHRMLAKTLWNKRNLAFTCFLFFIFCCCYCCSKFPFCWRIREKEREKHAHNRTSEMSSALKLENKR